MHAIMLRAYLLHNLTSSLALKNSTICLQCGFKYSAWISEQLAIIPYTALTIYISETRSVHCLAHTESWNITQVDFYLERTNMTQVIIDLSISY